MKQTQWIVLCLSVGIVHFSYALTPLNLVDSKRAIIEYYTSQQYDKDVANVTKAAETYLQKRIVQNKHSYLQQKLAVVFDIDDTCLTNFYALKKRDFSNLPNQIFAGYRNKHLPVIKPVLELYKKAIAAGVNVFFVSFRPLSVMASTRFNLYEAGYHHWQKIFLPDQKEFKLSPTIYKTKIRKQITDQGYTIVLNVGDQDTDFSGGYAEKISKIPNPLYTIATETKKC